MTDLRGPDPAAVVARVLAELRAKGLLRPEPVPEPPLPKRGPRVCPQRRCNKRVLPGPWARQPLKSGQKAPRVSTLLREAHMARLRGEHSSAPADANPLI